jgi:tetratricopeptide (TPR) repeat protein
MALAAEAGHRAPPTWLPKAAYESGRAYERLGRFYMALRCYTKALHLTADSDTIAPYEILQRRGRVKLRIKQFQPALKDLDRSVALAPNNALTYLNRAQAHEAMGDTAAAVEDLRAYLQLAGPQEPHRREASARIAGLTQ